MDRKEISRLGAVATVIARTMSELPDRVPAIGMYGKTPLYHLKRAPQGPVLERDRPLQRVGRFLPSTVVRGLLRSGWHSGDMVIGRDGGREYHKYVSAQFGIFPNARRELPSGTVAPDVGEWADFKADLPVLVPILRRMARETGEYHLVDGHFTAVERPDADQREQQLFRRLSTHLKGEELLRVWPDANRFLPPARSFSFGTAAVALLVLPEVVREVAASLRPGKPGRAPASRPAKRTTVYVTPSQVEAAKLLQELDQVIGRPTDPIVRRIAAAQPGSPRTSRTA